MFPSFAIIGSLALSEVLLIALVALIAFGGRLPEVALRGAAQVMRARRTLTRLWRDAGLEQELRRVQRDIESKIPREADFDVQSMAEARARSHARADGSTELDDGHPDGEGAEHESRTAEERLAAGIGLGAPLGTVAADIVDRREDAPDADSDVEPPSFERGPDPDPTTAAPGDDSGDGSGNGAEDGIGNGTDDNDGPDSARSA